MHVQGKFADLEFTVFARSKQASKHTHAQCNEVTLVWGSLKGRKKFGQFCNAGDCQQQINVQVQYIANLIISATLDRVVRIDLAFTMLKTTGFYLGTEVPKHSAGCVGMWYVCTSHLQWVRASVTTCSSLLIGCQTNL